MKTFSLAITPEIFDTVCQKSRQSAYALFSALLFFAAASTYAPPAEAAACTFVEATLAEHVANSRVTETTVQTCSGYVIAGSCIPYGYTYTTTYTTTGGDAVSGSGNISLYLGSDSLYYATDPDDCVSAADGSADGGADGAADGSADGAADGGADGAADGSADGAADGSADGAADGSADGAADGSADGAADGSADGAADGSADGAADGSADGAADGDGDSGPTTHTVNVQFLGTVSTVTFNPGDASHEITEGATLSIQMTITTAGFQITMPVNSCGGGVDPSTLIYTSDPVTNDCAVSFNVSAISSIPAAPMPTASPASGSGATGTGVRPNTMLIMNDSYLMNSEVLYSSTATETEFTDLTRFDEFFVNRRVIVESDYSAGTGEVKPPQYTNLPTGGYGFVGLGTKGTDPDYNILAFDVTKYYHAWPGYNRMDLDKCTYTTPSSGGSSETADNEAYCPKHFPQFDNSLSGNEAGCKELNNSSPTSTTLANADYCAPRDCNGNGCREVVPIDPDKSYWRVGLPWDNDTNGCFYLYTGPTSGSGDKAKCVPKDLFDSIWGAGSCGGMMQADCADIGTDVDYDATAYTGTGAGVGPFGCWINNLASGACARVMPATGYGYDFEYNGTYSFSYNGSPFMSVCENFFTQEWVWPCKGQYTGMQVEYVSNIISAAEILNHYFTDSAGAIKYVRDLDEDGRNNYATWFTYYRTRGHVQQAALLQASNQVKDNDRVGLFDSSGNIVDIKVMSSANRTALQNSIKAAKAGYTRTANNMLNALDEVRDYLETNKAYLYEGMAVDANDKSATCRQNLALMFATGLWNDASAPTTAGTGSVTGNALSNVSKNLVEMDIDNSLDDNVPTDGYSSNNKQHIKTWLLQLDGDPNLDSYSYADTTFETPPAAVSSSSDNLEDIAGASYSGKGAYQHLSSPADAIFAAEDLVDEMIDNPTMCPSLTNCGSTTGKRISWKEIKPQ